MKTAFDAEMEVWRESGRIRQALGRRQVVVELVTDEGKWVGWFSIVEQELVDVDGMHRFAERSEAARVQ